MMGFTSLNKASDQKEAFSGIGIKAVVIVVSEGRGATQLLFVVILGRRGRVLMKLYRVASASALVPSLHSAKMILIYLNNMWLWLR